MSNQTEIGTTDAPQMTIASPVMSNAEIMAQLALTPAPLEREPSKDDKLVRAGTIFRSKFNTDADKTLVMKLEGVPTIFVSNTGVVWTEVMSLQKNADGKVTSESKYAKSVLVLDVLHPSASGLSVIARGFGQTMTIAKEHYDLMVTGKERNAMVKRSAIQTTPYSA